MSLNYYWGQYIKRLEEYLDGSPIKPYLETAENKFKIKKRHMVLAVGLTIVCTTMHLMAPLVVSLMAFCYPAIKSIKSLESGDPEMTKKWLTYWIVYGTFSVAEVFVDILLSWFPMYFLVKMIFLIWCMSPTEYNGSIVVYRSVILPLFMQHEAPLRRVSIFSPMAEIIRSSSPLSDQNDSVYESANETLTNVN
ncbi:Oidioi.mRNA.OKI2018_I69.chr1.g2601.t2.cds [Oikopleura dioica]|uniref:Receptor expression-enhancing protein n=1 Tax=Oikopleura dioica TaxID=34765 RepID=A0ABN7SVH6_OIKDI|nr:Oidioi.mRNA.OKI2018_I69.chr1.g2601.t2.cds [Oikopleura dioica]